MTGAQSNARKDCSIYPRCQLGRSRSTAKLMTAQTIGEQPSRFLEDSLKLDADLRENGLDPNEFLTSADARQALYEVAPSLKPAPPSRYVEHFAKGVVITETVELTIDDLLDGTQGESQVQVTFSQGGEDVEFSTVEEAYRRAEQVADEIGARLYGSCPSKESFEAERIERAKARRELAKEEKQELLDAALTLKHAGYNVPVQKVAREEQASVFGQPRRLDFLLDYDTENDPNNVIGNRWICRGRSFILVSQSGVGKSSILAQLSLGWALKKTELTFNIEPIRPLRQMIVQAENDDGDVAEPAQGIAKGFGLTGDEVKSASRLVEWHEVVGLSGEAFLDLLEDELNAREERGEPIDVCWIDPLNNFMGGDISRIEDTKLFTNRLDVIGKRLGTIFALIHHTGKPKQEETKATASDLAYSMLGSSGLTNWAREVMVLKREHVEEGETPTFSLTATKRRKKAGMVTIAAENEGGTGKPTEAIFVRHASDGSIRWEQCPTPDSSEDDAPRRSGGKKQKPKGRPSSVTAEQKLLIAEAVAENDGDPLIGVEKINKLALKLGKTPVSIRKYLNEVAEQRKIAQQELEAESKKRLAEINKKIEQHQKTGDNYLSADRSLDEALEAGK